jgi:cytochrome c oxidase subunit I+III
MSAITGDGVPGGTDGARPGTRDDERHLTPPITDPQRSDLLRVWTPPSGLRFLAEINNSVIGMYYLLTALGFLAAGGVLALMMRWQLAVPDNDFLSPAIYNQVFTMHGTTMMFLFAVPAVEAVAVYLMPQMLGARDLPFPRLSAFGYWCYLFGGTLAFSSIFFGLAPDGGWFMYTPLTTQEYSPGINADVWLLGIGFIEISAITAAIEIIVGLLRTRAPGMSLNRVPLFAWAVFVTAAMILFGFPPMLMGDALLELQRALDLPFFDPKRGGDPLLWQHLFWLFGHPEVYIIFLPAAGIVSMIVPTFAQRPFVGYTWVVVATIGVGFISFALWVHHMFATGLPHLSLAFFSAASMMVVVPNAIQFFCWIATLWAGKPAPGRMMLPMLYLVGFFSVFLLGGLTGVMVAVIPFDWQAHDSYFVVAHLHYVLIGGMVFPLLAGIVYWLPLATGRLMDERLGRRAFWLLFAGFNIAFLPMHWTGLIGMPRRVYTYSSDMGWSTLNLVSSAGALMLGIGFALFAYATWHAWRRGRPAGANPWNAGTMEWVEGTPMPVFSVTSVPVVTSRYPLWEQPALAEHVRTGRYYLGHAQSGQRETIVTSAIDALPDYVLRLPRPTFVPMVMAILVTISFVALTFKANLLALVAGVLVVPVAYWWVWHTEAPVDEQVEIGRGEVLPAYAHGPRSVQFSGLLVTVIFDAVAYGALLFSYLYLFTARGMPWPPAGYDALPDVAVSIVGVVALSIIIAGTLSLRAVRADHRIATAAGIVALIVLHIALAVTALMALGDTSATRDAYGATLWTVGGYVIAHAVVTLLMLPYTLVSLFAGRLYARRPLGLQNTVLFSHYTALAALAGFALIWLFPMALGHG